MQRMPLKLRAQLALPAVQGMAYLHDMGVIHFDIKPANMLLDEPIGNLDQRIPVVKITDLGISEHDHHVQPRPR